MDRNDSRIDQSLERFPVEEGQSTIPRGAQNLENFSPGVESEDNNESQSPNDSERGLYAAGVSSNRAGHGSAIARNNTVTESGYDSNNLTTTSEVAGSDSSISSLGEASGYDANHATFVKHGDNGNDVTSHDDNMAEVCATAVENYNPAVGHSDSGEMQEVRPVQVTSEIAQERGEQFDVELHSAAVPVVNFNRLAAVPPQDIDLRRRRQFGNRGRLTRCLTCFQLPVAVQNWPCGCMCNCLRCAPCMIKCAQCKDYINHYTVIL